MSLVLVDLFADTRELLLALAVWIGGCTYVAVYLRDVPAAYGAMLSGYTAAIIGVPAALAPLTAFDSAWARCLEITLGIACATLVSRLVLPRTAGDALQATLDAAWLRPGSGPSTCCVGRARRPRAGRPAQAGRRHRQA